NPAITEMYLIVASLMNLFPQWSNIDNAKNHNTTPLIIAEMFNNAVVFVTVWAADDKIAPNTPNHQITVNGFDIVIRYPATKELLLVLGSLWSKSIFSEYCLMFCHPRYIKTAAPRIQMADLTTGTVMKLASPK
ncbi:MAG: hypothetical protein NWE77_03905, partial [Candidatus Bathyarchaeota archaeon]|nr:hypothetical protein [Candidatus Bathyarchaeota archaeon]